MRLSDPDVKEPTLPSAGFDMMKATKHKFVGFEPCIVKYTNRDVKAQAVIYECTETGVRRRWGYR